MCLQYEYSKEIEIENKKYNDTQVKLHNQIETLNDTITKLENINSDTLLNYQALNNENTALKKVFIFCSIMSVLKSENLCYYICQKFFRI